MSEENTVEETKVVDDMAKKKRGRRNMPFATMPANACNNTSVM